MATRTRLSASSEPPRLWRWWRQQLGAGTFTLLVLLPGLHVALLAGMRFAPESTIWLVDDALSLSLPGLLQGKLWTLWTYGLLHDLRSPLHLVFNAIGLWFLSPQLEARLGTARWLRFALWSVAAGGAAQMLLAWLTGESQRVVGISALNLALLGQFAWQRPNAQILLLFVPVRAKWVVPISVGLDLLMWLTPGGSVAIGAHLGGLAASWLWLRGGERRLDRLTARVRWWWLGVRGKRPDVSGLSRGHLRVVQGGKSQPPPRDEWN